MCPHSVVAHVLYTLVWQYNCWEILFEEPDWVKYFGEVRVNNCSIFNSIWGVFHCTDGKIGLWRGNCTKREYISVLMAILPVVRHVFGDSFGSILYFNKYRPFYNAALSSSGKWNKRWHHFRKLRKKIVCPQWWLPKVIEASIFVKILAFKLHRRQD